MAARVSSWGRGACAGRPTRHSPTGIGGGDIAAAARRLAAPLRTSSAKAGHLPGYAFAAGPNSPGFPGKGGGAADDMIDRDDYVPHFSLLIDASSQLRWMPRASTSFVQEFLDRAILPLSQMSDSPSPWPSPASGRGDSGGEACLDSPLARGAGEGRVRGLSQPSGRSSNGTEADP